MSIQFRVALLAALLVAAPGCGKSSTPTAPYTPSLTGTWVGGNFFQGQPLGRLTLQLTQTASSLNGTWTSTQDIGGATAAGPAGSMNGTLNGSNVSMTFSLNVVTPDCSFPIRVTATVNGNQMTGTYATVSCSFVLSGNITLVKQ